MRKFLTISVLLVLLASPGYAALSASTIAEVQNGGNDTSNSGLFDPSQTAGFFTDGAATVANTTAPVFTSASYNFVAGDAGAWVYIASGSNWTPGWYKISSVASNAATLDATLGHAVGKAPQVPSTAAGCATTASPTAATWTIDYSQQSSPKVTYTDLASAGTGLTISSVAHPFAKQQVGNSLVITSGTNLNTGRYVIASVSGVTATVVGPTNITTGVGASGVGSLGGAFASPGQADAPLVAGNEMFIASGTYSVTSASTNVAAGCVLTSVNQRIEGYGTVRGDRGTPPLIQASGISTFTLLKNASASRGVWMNLTLDGASLTSSQGLSVANEYFVYLVTAKNFTNGGLIGTTGSYFLQCSATTCSTVTAFQPTNCYSCESYSNTFTGFAAASVGGHIVSSLAYGNSGATSDGFLNATGSGTCFLNCVAYNNGRDGFRQSTPDAAWINCIAEGNVGIGFNAGANASVLGYCATYNNGTVSSLTSLYADLLINSIITGSSSFFVNAAGGNFALNNTTGAGALLRAAGFPTTFPTGTTTTYRDIGAAQHQDPPNSSPISAKILEKIQKWDSVAMAQSSALSNPIGQKRKHPPVTTPQPVQSSLAIPLGLLGLAGLGALVYSRLNPHA